MDRAKVDLWVGVIVATALVALLVAIFEAGTVGAGTPSTVYRVEARFDNIGGLNVEAPVRSAGVLVGRVASIRFDNDSFQAVVSLDIDGRYRFPGDSSASILSSGRLGDRYIAIDAGSDDRRLEPESRITATHSAVVIENVIGQFLFSNNKGEARKAAPQTAQGLP